MIHPHSYKIKVRNCKINIFQWYGNVFLRWLTEVPSQEGNSCFIVLSIVSPHGFVCLICAV